MFWTFSIVVINSYALSQEAYPIKVRNRNFIFYDIRNSETVGGLQKELERDNYKISSIKFERGDVVVDIGGNIGGFAIPLAVEYPFLKIYSFEPVKQTFENFKKNIMVNNVSPEIITLSHKAVTGDGRNVTMEVNKINSMLAAMSGYHSNCTYCTGYNDKSKFIEEREKVESVTLKEIFEHFNISRCKLLKIDCEGCEYETLYSTPNAVLSKIEIFRGEFHGHKLENWNPRQLMKDMRKKFADFYVELGSQWLVNERKERKKRKNKKNKKQKTD